MHLMTPILPPLPAQHTLSVVPGELLLQNPTGGRFVLHPHHIPVSIWEPIGDTVPSTVDSW